MLHVAPSFIISHGMLDYLTYTKTIDFFAYVILVILNYLMFYISSDLIFLLFLLSSMYHFGEDFRFLTKGNDIDRIAGIMLVSGFGVYDNTDTFNYIEKLLNLNSLLFNQFFISFYIFSLISCIFCNKNIKLLTVLINILFMSINTNIIFLTYMNFVHVPIAIYRYYKEYGKDVVISWLFYIIVVMLLMPKVINLFIIKLSISIVNVHMLYITRWQLKN